MPIKPKPWPYVALRHKREAEDAAKQIGMLGAMVKQALRDRNYDLALAIVTQMQQAARIIELTLEAAPGNGEEDEEDE